MPELIVAIMLLPSGAQVIVLGMQAFGTAVVAPAVPQRRLQLSPRIGANLRAPVILRAVLSLITVGLSSHTPT